MVEKVSFQNHCDQRLDKHYHQSIMKNILLLSTLILSLSACKNEKKESTITETMVADVVTDTTPAYPETMQAVFDAHGGTDAWQKMKALYFEIPKESGAEKHTVALQDRRSFIETDRWSIGYDGSEVWLLEQEADVYKGNARFYHNLMFYFYAMPFVLADDGIQYESVPATQLDGISYDGVKISYIDGVGDAPKDEYIVYFDAETHQMKWLGYTVTYGKTEKSDNWRFIKYAAWTTQNGLVLPKALTWYQVEEGKPTTPRNTMTFENISISETQPEAGQFMKPEGAVVSE